MTRHRTALLLLLTICMTAGFALCLALVQVQRLTLRQERVRNAAIEREYTGTDWCQILDCEED